jgi:hypothetical protein
VLEVLVFPRGVDAVEQQGFGGAKGVKRLTLGLGEVNMPEFVEGAGAGGESVGAEGRVVG